MILDTGNECISDFVAEALSSPGACLNENRININGMLPKAHRCSSCDSDLHYFAQTKNSPWA